MGLYNDTTTRDDILMQLSAMGFDRDALRHLNAEQLRRILDAHADE